MSGIYNEAVEGGNLVLETQKDDQELNCNGVYTNVGEQYLNKPKQHRSILQNSASENTNPTGYDSTEDNSDTASSSLQKKKKKLTKFREKEIYFSDGSSNSDIDELPQQSSRHKRRKKSKKSDDDNSDDSIQTPGTLQEIRNSFGTTDKYIDDLLSYLKYNIKYVTNEELKKELNEKMINLEMEHKRKQKDLEGC